MRAKENIDNKAIFHPQYIKNIHYTFFEILKFSSFLFIMCLLQHELSLNTSQKPRERHPSTWSGKKNILRRNLEQDLAHWGDPPV